MNYVILKTSDDMREAYVGSCVKAEDATDLIMGHIKSNLEEGYPQAYIVFNLRTGLATAYEPEVSINLKEV